jgi:Ca2+-binding RTX toxin-like protein
VPPTRLGAVVTLSCLVEGTLQMLLDPKLKKPRLVASVAALAAYVSLSGKAQAANADVAAGQTTGLVNIDNLPGVVATAMRDDGSVIITFEDGSVRILAPGEFIVEGGEIFIDPAAIAELSLAGGVDPLIIALGVIGIAGAGIAIASSGSNSAPAINSANAVSVGENAVATGLTVTALDPDDDPVTFSIVGGADAARFSINPTTGALSFVAAPDFENPADANRDNVFEVQVAATDGELQATQTIRVTVNNLNDNSPVITSGGAVTIAENLTNVIQATASDADGNPVTFSLSGTDAALFAINAATGAITFIGAPNFEAPGDANRDNVYQLVVTASDGTNSTTQNLAVTVTNVNDIAPVIASGAAFSIRENSTAVTQVMASDAEGDAITFSLSGADAALFTINATTGVLAFIAAPDFENPADADRNNAYQVTVTASDGVNRTAQNLTITVTDQNEVTGTDGNDVLIGSAGDDIISGRGGDDDIDSLTGTDTLTGGEGSDDFLFDLASVNDGLTEDSITDFAFASDRFVLDAASFGVDGPVVFASVDANAAGATIAAGANVVVLLNSDNDANPATAFNARTAATQIAGLVSEDAPGFFVYFNSGLQVNRLVFSSNLNDPNAPLQIINRLTDLTGQAAIDALANFTGGNFVFDPLLVLGTDGNDVLLGSAASEVIDALAGDDVIESLAGSDTLSGGEGNDVFAFAGDPFEGTDVSAAGRQVIGNEDFISDFDFANDQYRFDAADYGVDGTVVFAAVDATAPGATIPVGANVIVLLNSDNDANPATAFNAGAAANQIAALVDEPGPGFFVYFNSSLNVNRLVYSTDLSDPTADLKIVSRQTDLTGQDAIDALANFTADNFEFVGDAGATVLSEVDEIALQGVANETVPLADVFGSDDVDSGTGAIQTASTTPPSDISANDLFADPLDDLALAALAQAQVDAVAGGF